MSDKNRMEWVVLGRVIGTGTGWDQADTFVMQIYDFEPAVNVNLPKSDCLTIDFEAGTASTCDDAGVVTSSVDLMSAIAGIPAIVKQI